MKAAVLFPGKQNHWVLAFPHFTGSESDRARKAEVWFRTWFGDAYEDLRVTGSQVGDFASIKAHWVSIDPDLNSYNAPDTAYVAIAFDFLGDADFIEWPEHTGGVLAGVVQGVPTIHLKTPLEEGIDTIGHTIDDVKKDAASLSLASGLTLGGLALGGFLLLRALGGKR